MTTITFVVPGPPVAKGRPIASRRGPGISMRTPEKTVRYESLVALVATQAMSGRPGPVDGPVMVSATAWMAVSASWSKKRQAAALAGEVYPTGKPDADNIGKSLGDGANGIVWTDDSRIVDLHVRKRYGPVPHLQVAVTWAGSGPT